MLSGTIRAARRLTKGRAVNRPYSTSEDPSMAEKKTKLHLSVERDLARGNLWEVGQLKKSPDGRIWQGHEVLAEQKVFWPSSMMKMRGSGLIKKDDLDLAELFKSQPATFVLVGQKRPFAVNQIDSWTLPLRETHPDLPILDLSVFKNLGYWWLSPVLSSISKAQDKVNARFGYLYTSPTTNLTTKEFGLDIENGFLNYQFVVDQNMAIRWRSVGTATPDDLTRVSNIINKLQGNAIKETPKRVADSLKHHKTDL